MGVILGNMVDDGWKVLDTNTGTWPQNELASTVRHVREKGQNVELLEAAGELLHDGQTYAHRKYVFE
jgi:hypothetical protein